MTTAARRELRDAWEACLRDGAPAVVMSVLRARPEVMVPCGHEYPHVHRICDVILDGNAYRLLRCATCEEELTLMPVARELAITNASGVPYGLSGCALRRWVEDEAREPAEGPVDWDAYRQGCGRAAGGGRP